MKNSIINNTIYQQHIQQFGDYLQAMGYAKKTVIGTPRLIADFFEYLETNQIYDIEAIKRGDIEDFMSYQANRPNLRKGLEILSLVSLTKYYQAIVNFDRYLSNTQQGALNMPLSRNLARAEKKIIVLTQTEVKQLYQVCDLSSPYGIRDRAFLSLFYGCGLRRNEGINLEVDDIKFTHKLIHVRLGKGRKERYVPMNKAVIEDLERYIHESRPTFIIDPAKAKTALLLSQRGIKPTGETINNRLTKLKKETNNSSLKSKNITLHLLRHSIATHLLGQGMSLKRVAQFLGHSQLDTTQIYTHLNNGKFY